MQNVAQEGRKFNPNEVIRLAQNKRAKNEKTYTSFTAESYQKNQAFLDKVPFDILLISGRIIPEKKDTGEVYWSEKYSRYEYLDRHSFTDSVLKFRAAGTIPVPNANTLSDLDLSLFHKKIFFRSGNARGFVSPLAPNALRFYDFTAEDVFTHRGRKVYRIGFSPKRRASAALHGTMELYDSTFTLHKTAFSLTAQNQLEFLDSIYIEQEYLYEYDNYQLESQNISYFLKIIGYQASYFIEEDFFDFRYEEKEKNEPKNRKAKEIIPEVITNQPVLPKAENLYPLSEREQFLLEEENLNPLFKEEYSKTEFLHAPFKFWSWLFSSYKIRHPSYAVDLKPFYYSPGYNTVEGIYLRYDAPVAFYFNQKELRLQPTFRYGFSDREFKLKARVDYFFDLRHPKDLRLAGGRSYQQFNETNPILPVLNSLYSAFLGQNFLKLYGKDFAQIGYGQEIFNGFQITAELEAGRRFPVFNITDFHITGDPENFTPNNPTIGNVIDNQGFEDSRALNLDVKFSFQTKQLYNIVNGRKINLEMETPRFYGRFRQGIPTGIFTTDFSFAMLGSSFTTPLGAVGTTRWDVSGGRFFRKKNLPFVDYKHFDGTQTLFLQPTASDQSTIKQFSTLRYYGFSTDKAFVEIHAEHRFDGFLLSRIPLMRRLSIHSFFGVNYLNNFEREQFLEFVIGFDNILRGLRLEAAGGIDNFTAFSPSVRLGIDFNYRFYRQNKK